MAESQERFYSFVFFCEDISLILSIFQQLSTYPGLLTKFTGETAENTGGDESGVEMSHSEQQTGDTIDDHTGLHRRFVTDLVD